jgi:hypothetical protein
MYETMVGWETMDTAAKAPFKLHFAHAEENEGWDSIRLAYAPWGDSSRPHGSTYRPAIAATTREYRDRLLLISEIKSPNLLLRVCSFTFAGKARYHSSAERLSGGAAFS